MHTLEQLRSGALAGLRRLNLSCGLTEFPREIFDLADTLEILNLSGNALSELPADLPRLHRLKVLFCSDNRFTQLPEAIGACGQLEMVGFKANQIRHVPAAALPPKLRWLILTDNAIEALPAGLGSCPQLQKLMLAGNRLSQLPEDLSTCGQLELLRIAANRLTELPDWLLSLPRLSWLAYAGNPQIHSSTCVQTVDKNLVPAIDWGKLSLQQQLGAGASGFIHKACLKDINNLSTEVAIKLFKGTMTSDGLPDSEMAACIAAGSHPQLISMIGVIHSHPAGTPGLVLPLIEPSFANLAGPPSLASCTRDVYPAGWRIPVDNLLAIVRGIASAAAHLHARGILHGDLYGHNILWNGLDQVRLGDFGAASFYRPDGSASAQALQRIEVRTFGCLLEELLMHCDTTAPHGQTLPRLAALQARCLHTEVRARPDFAEIVQTLTEL
ncbi:MAG: leucine-rich repeat-containing protein kinase family protein [Leptothrix sp. (in: b-proteobacteria)]